MSVPPAPPHTDLQARWLPWTVAATQAACVALVGLAVVRPLSTLMTERIGVVLEPLTLFFYLASCAIAVQRTRGTRRSVFLGVGGAALFAAIGQVFSTIQLAGGEPERFPSPSLLLFLFGTQPSILLGFAGAIGWRDRTLSLERRLDALIIASAAAILGIAFTELTPWNVEQATPLTDALVLFWRCLPTTLLLLTAVLLAVRGTEFGWRMSWAVALGTGAFALGTALFSEVALRGRVGLIDTIDPLWAVALFFYASAMRDALTPTAETPLQGRASRLVWDRMLTGAVVVAVTAAIVLGFRSGPSPALAVATAVFIALLGVRVSRALAAQRREAALLANSVKAERQLSETLEHRVGERTRALADTQRVLQRMWTHGQELTLEVTSAGVLERFLEAVTDVAQADGAAVALRDGDALRVVAASGELAAMQDERIPLEGSAAGRVVRGGMPWRVRDLTEHLGMVYVPAYVQAGGSPPRGMVVVPVHRGDSTIGAVEVVSLIARDFGDAELTSLGAMADMLSVALANAELVETLREAESRFRTLFRSAPDAVISVLDDGTVGEANDSVRELLGRDPDELPGTPVESFVAPEDRDRLAAGLAAAATGTPQRLELRLLHGAPRSADDPGPASGQVRLVSLALSRLPGAEPATVLLVGRDVTEEREMRARLLETERLAAVGELVAGVAHEVNNPLSSISAYAQLLVRDGGLNEYQRESLEVIRGETVRASQVVKDLLTFARRSAPERESLDLNQLVERTLRLRSYQLSDARVRLGLDLQQALPPVVGDARQLQQVILNLVTNSVQAMAPKGGGTLSVTTRRESGAIQLRIADTGGGIAPNARARIFEPFFTTKPEGEGTGLGLSVSYGIIAAHGGSLVLADSSASGTTFVVTLPVSTGAALPDVVHEAAPLGDRSPIAGRRFLFVDDEAAIRNGVSAFGRMRGFEVVPAADAEEGLRRIREGKYDAVVCDLRMPGVDGVGFFEALQRERPELADHFVFVTGDMLSMTGRYAPAAHMPTLQKPFSFEQLEELLTLVSRGVERRGVRARS